MAYSPIVIPKTARRVVFLRPDTYHGISSGTVAVAMVGDRYFGTPNGSGRWIGNMWWRTDQNGTDGLLHSVESAPYPLPEKFQNCHVGYRLRRITISEQIFYV